MPKLSAQELINPTADPFLYPGHPVTEDSLIAGNWIYRMPARRGRPVGDYAPVIDGGPASGMKGDSLNDALSHLGVTPINDRYPVVAVGSNAAPGQLAHKYRASWESTVIPLTAAYVSGMGVGYSAHINRAGYMPFTPCRTQPNGCRVLVLWLDAEQLARMNETEPNYHPSTVAGGEFQAALSSREPLSSFVVYRSKWGVFREQPGDGPLPAGKQEEVFDALSRLAWFSDLVPESNQGPEAAIAALVADEGRRDEVRALLAKRGHARPDGLPPVVSEPMPYGKGAGAAAWGVAGAWG